MVKSIYCSHRGPEFSPSNHDHNHLSSEDPICALYSHLQLATHTHVLQLERKCYLSNDMVYNYYSSLTEMTIVNNNMNHIQTKRSLFPTYLKYKH